MPVSESLWRTLAAKALTGKDTVDASLAALTSRTAEGLALAPLYGRSRAPAPPASRQEPGGWRIAQRVDHPDPDEANRLALLDLDGGANALTLVFEGETARGFGLPLQDAALDAALAGVELDYIALRIDAGARAAAAAALLAGLTKARRLAGASLAIDLGLDPLGSLARTGVEPVVMTDEDLRGLRAASRDAGLAGRLFLADGRPYHEAGAGEAQELAAVLSTGLAYLRRLGDAGVDLDDASAAIGWLLVADADTVLSIAKFRALRRLWARVEAACGLTPRPLHLHAETAWRMMTRRDPAVNVMRATAAVFAAGVGGADQIAALPFTAALGMPEDGARRLARNTHLILLEEAHLARVEDPAAGSGALESVTDALCARAWALVQAIEREGGLAASLRTGALQARIAETAAHRAMAIATMRDAITGTSTFPALDEDPVALGTAVRRAPAPHGALALPAQRDAEPFEALRDRAEAMAGATGRRPVVFLATLESPASHGPRATYAANFFAAAGIAARTGAVDAYDPTLTPIACLCGSGSLQAEGSRAAVARLRQAGAARVLQAGRPDGADDPGPDTPDGFIHHGCDALQALEDTLDLLSAPATGHGARSAL